MRMRPTSGLKVIIIEVGTQGDFEMRARLKNGETTSCICFVVPVSVERHLNEVAKMEGRTKAAVLRDALELYFASLKVPTIKNPR